MQWPIVDHLWILLVGLPLLAVDVERDFGEVNLHGEVMPLVVAHLADLPAPLGRAEDVGVALGEVATQQQDQTAISDEQGVVVSIHFCRQNKNQLIQ